jgi:hypothetical protein
MCRKQKKRELGIAEGCFADHPFIKGQPNKTEPASLADLILDLVLF